MAKVVDLQTRRTTPTQRTLSDFWRRLRALESIVSERLDLGAGLGLSDREVQDVSIVLGALHMALLSRSNRKLGRERNASLRKRPPVKHLREAAEEVIEAVGLAFTSPSHYRARMIDSVALVFRKGRPDPATLIAEMLVQALDRCHFAAPALGLTPQAAADLVKESISPKVQSATGGEDRKLKLDTPESIVDTGMMALGFAKKDRGAGERMKKWRARQRNARKPA